MFFVIIIPASAGDDNKEEQQNQILTDLLSDDSQISGNTLEMISAEKPDNLLPALVSVILSDKDAGKKDAAVKAFSFYLPDVTHDFCVQILKESRSFFVKKAIIDYVSKNMSKELVPLITEELASPFFLIRESAVRALKNIGDDRMFPFIVNMLENPNPVFRVYALEALYHLYDLRFYDQLIRLLKDENKSIRYYTLRCIEKNKLTAAFKQIRNTALNDSDWEVRIRAIFVLENLSDSDSLWVLLKCLNDDNREIRYASAIALKKFLFKKSAREISNSLSSETDDEIKTILIGILISLNNHGGYKGLKKTLLEDKNYKIRVFSAYALGLIKKKYSETLLLESIEDRSKEVRAEVCNSLASFKNGNAILKLLEVINDDQDLYVRSAALFTVRKIGGGFAVLPLFERYTIEQNPVFKEQLETVISALIREIKYK